MTNKYYQKKKTKSLERKHVKDIKTTKKDSKRNTRKKKIKISIIYQYLSEEKKKTKKNLRKISKSF